MVGILGFFERGIVGIKLMSELKPPSFAKLKTVLLNIGLRFRYCDRYRNRFFFPLFPFSHLMPPVPASPNPPG